MNNRILALIAFSIALFASLYSILIGVIIACVAGAIVAYDVYWDEERLRVMELARKRLIDNVEHLEERIAQLEKGKH